MNLTIVASFYLISVIFLGLAVDMNGLELLWLIVIPAVYLVFLSVAGITVNLAFPVLNWENEVRVIKQSASMLVTMLVGMVSSIFPLIGSVFIINVVVILVIMILTGALYRRNNRVVLT